MSTSKDEYQSAQEGETPPAKQEGTPQQDVDKKIKPKQSQQVANDIKWVPFLIGFHLVTRALNRLSLRRPSALRQEEREVRSANWHCFSDAELHRYGNLGIITYQTLLFLINNYSVLVGDVEGEVPRIIKGVAATIFVLLGVSSVFFYYLAADRTSPITSSRNKPALWLFLLALLFAAPAVPMFIWTNPGEHIWIKLVVGTVCQFAAGCVGWRASNLIPSPSAGNSKESA